MTNVKISKKGKALLKRSYASATVAKAVAGAGKNLSTKNGISVTVNGQSITIKSVSSLSPEEILAISSK